MKNRKLVRVILVVIAASLILVAGIQLSFYLFFNKWLKEYVINEVNSSNIYVVSIGDLSVNLFTRKLSIKQASFSPAERNAGKAYYMINAGSVLVSGPGLISWLFRDALEFERIAFSNAKIIVFQGKEQAQADSTFSLFNIIRSKFKSFKVDKVLFLNAEMKLARSADSVPVAAAGRTNIILKGLLIDEETEKKGKFLAADSFYIAMNDIMWQLENDLYKLKASTLFASFTDSVLIIDSLKLQPLLPPQAFFKKVKKQTDRFTMSLTRLVLNGMEVRRFIETGAIASSKADLNGMMLHAYRDKNYERLTEVIKPLQAALFDLPLSLNIGLLALSDSYVEYRERAKDAESDGRVYFTGLNATVKGIDNRKRHHGHDLTVNASARLMGKGVMKSTLKFPMDSDQPVFTCSGSLESMKLEEMNEMTEPVAAVSIKSGNLHSLNFSFLAGHNYSEGSLEFLYNDLKVELLDSKGGHNDPVKGLITFVANIGFIHDANPEEGKPPRKGHILSVRNPQRFIFNYAWKSIFTGIADIVKAENKKDNN